jgi:EAL domain-containing protein (putative c-di-GMP-specific phosphodiesterase class I)/GGDEF domain-containing protein
MRVEEPHDRSEQWMARLEAVGHAFQPIVGIHTGQCYGYECLLRGFDRAGFASISEFFDAACQDGVLCLVEHALRRKALRTFERIPHCASVRLFINIDNRYFDEAQRSGLVMGEVLRAEKLNWSSVCLEISEQHPLLGQREMQPALLAFRQSDIRIALDDFGVGFSGLQALFCIEPDFIKIDRFFITDMERDAKKKIFVTTMVNAAHLLGSLVVAEGIETEEEFRACRDIGCDFVQGFYIQRPVQDLDGLRLKYPIVEETIRRDRHRISSDGHLINLQVEPLQPIPVDADLQQVLGAFREQPQTTFFPVVNAHLEPQGILRESEVKAYVQAQQGRERLADRSSGWTIRTLVTKCPISDIHSRTERILETLSMYPSAEGVLIVRDMQYLGFLSARALSRIAREKDLTAANDQHPLSKLPGTYAVHQYLADVAEQVEQSFLLAYFDFDGFRRFNEGHGFHEGDRAIVLFAEALKRRLLDDGHFLGHPGGDGFLVGFRHVDFELAFSNAVQLVRQFRTEMESLYKPQERQMGFVVSRDHEGRPVQVPLLRVNAMLLCLPAGRQATTPDDLMSTLVALKGRARTSSENLSAASVRRYLPPHSSGG